MASTRHTAHIFRPRPIDVNQPLPIVIDDGVQYEDDEACEKASPVGRAAQHKETIQLLDVHTPLYRIVEDKTELKVPRFARPHSFIEYREKAPEDYGDVEYEADMNDEMFMDALNGRLRAHTTVRGVRTRGSASKSDVPAYILDVQLEQLIDSFEKEAFFKMGLRQIRDASSIGALCGVCNDSDYDSDNILLLCNGCNTTVHQQCYGAVHATHGTWLCSRCESRDSSALCALCNGKDGALKRTVDDRWVHVLCALYMPEISFGHPTTLEPVSGVDRIPRDKWNKRCSLCNEGNGVCVPCDQKDCVVVYHIGCARAFGLYVESKPGPDGTPLLATYCKLHSLSRLDHYPSYPHDYHLDMPVTLRLASELGIRSEDFGIIYSYWRMKRLVHIPPLLPRLRVLSENGYTPGNSSLSGAEYRARFVKLRQDFERARILVDLVRKRELAKRQHLQLYVDTLELLDEPPSKRSSKPQ